MTLTCGESETDIAVEDNGIGIAPEHVSRIFDRFYRVHKGSEQGVGGAGLGLSIVRSIATSLGGRVDVKTAPQAGSVFRVSLPRTP